MIAFSSRPPGSRRRGRRRAAARSSRARARSCPAARRCPRARRHGPRRGLRPDRGVPGRAVLDDRRHRRDRLDVVDQRRRPVEPAHRRERRPRARLPPLALQRLEQRRLLAADVGARAAVEDDRDVAEQARLAHVRQRRAHDLEDVEVLAAEVDEDVLRLDPVRRHEAALDQPVRVAEHDLAVLERSGLRFVRVDAEVGRLARALREEARLAAHREPGAAAAAQVRRDQLVDDRLRLHPARLLERLVAADRLVLGELRQVALVRVGEGDHVDVSHRAPPRRSRGRPPAAPARGSARRRRPPARARSRPRTRSSAA